MWIFGTCIRYEQLLSRLSVALHGSQTPRDLAIGLKIQRVENVHSLLKALTWKKTHNFDFVGISILLGLSFGATATHTHTQHSVNFSFVRAFVSMHIAHVFESVVRWPCVETVHVSQLNSYIKNDELMNLWNVNARMCVSNHLRSHTPMRSCTARTFALLLLLCICVRSGHQFTYTRIAHTHNPVECILHALLILRAWLTSERVSHSRTEQQFTKHEKICCTLDAHRTRYICIRADKSTRICTRMNKKKRSSSIHLPHTASHRLPPCT